MAAVMEAERSKSECDPATVSHYGMEHLNDVCEEAENELADVLLDIRWWTTEPQGLP